jgi:tetratricopeptide (TPR) repeat protein
MPLFGRGEPDVKKLKARRDVKGLIKALGYKRDNDLRWMAANALGELGDSRAVVPLIAALQDTYSYARKSAARALLQLGDARALAPLLQAFRSAPPTTIPPDGALGQNDGEEEDGVLASAVLGLPGGLTYVQSTCAPDEFERLVVLGYSNKSNEDPEVIGALMALATPKAIGSLIETLARHGEPMFKGYRSPTAKKLAKDALVAAGVKVHPHLLQALTKRPPDVEKRKAVLAILADTGDEQCVPAITALAQEGSAVAAEAQAALAAIARRNPSITVPDSMAPQPLAVKTIASTGDAYVDSCFRLEFEEFEDARDWETIPEAAAVPEAGNHGKLDEAVRLAAALRDKYPDFYFSYSWLGIIYTKQGRYDDARRSLEEGLRASKRKHDLCGDRGDTELAAGNLAEAVRWWMKSAVIQIGINDPHDQYPFLNLSYVAEGLSLGGATTRLRDVVDRIGVGIRYAPPRANELYRVIQRDGSAAMKRAIELLDSEYIRPWLT